MAAKSGGNRLANVTLVGEKLAREGVEFMFLGPCQDCRDCKVKTACFNLEEGRVYRIVRVREMTHACSLHEGVARAVEYEALPIVAVVESKGASEGAHQKIAPQNCKRTLCENYAVCVRATARRKDTFRIVEIEGDVSCLLGRSLKKVRVEPA